MVGAMLAEKCATLRQSQTHALSLGRTKGNCEAARGDGGVEEDED